ncbi:MAG: extracellular solute-binding protein [Clostridiales bacterium]|nr:extracellular solute-binding protein [Clostridiales bacterium]
MKKLTLLLLAAMLIATFAACGGTEGAASVTTTAASDTEVTEVTTEAEILPELPEADYEGADFTILTAGNWSIEWTEIDEFFAEDETGEPVNDAVYRRNRLVEDQFNVSIVEINKMGNSIGGTNKGMQFIITSVLAGDSAYDASHMGAYDVSTLAYQGYIRDLNEVPYIDLTKPWWDQKANEDLEMRGRMYYSTGDIATLDNDCTFCILFNKKLIEDYEFDNPYELVRDSGWTIDKMVEMATSISQDLNGDGIHDENDLYGFCIWQDSMMGIIHASEEKFCSINNDGDLVLTLNTEKSLNAFEKYIKLAYDRNVAYSIYHSKDAIETMFANDQVLLYTRYLCIIKKYRNMDTDFGLLPYPKYSETQDKYFSTIAPYGCSFICVPMVVKNEEMSGAVLESMAYESVDTVTAAYYDITLEGKMMRDEESSAMLDIILGNRVFDLGLFYQVGTYNERIMDLFRQNNKDFTSMYAKHEASALAKLDEINAAFEAVS